VWVSPRRSPRPQQANQAIACLLETGQTGADIFEALDEVRPLHPKYNTFPGEVFLRLAAESLGQGG
jgi:hypothetical protein